MTFNLADLFENAVDAFGDRAYLVAEGKRRTYAQMEERANRLAHHLAANGVGQGDHVGIYSLNSVEWVETAWAVFKLRAVWININFRYVEDELRYLFTNADLKALVHQRSFSPQVAGVLGDLPDLSHIITVEDGSDAPLPTANAVAYEDAVASGGPERDFGPRSSDDHYILYTGGTTGMPKGVVWRHEDVFYALGGGIDPMTNTRIERPEQLVEKGLAGSPMTSLPIAPLMHGASQWAVMGQSFHGNRVVLVSKFTPQEVWRLVGAEKVNSIMITGDAMGKPLVEALDEPGASYDLSSLYAVVSTAALFSAPVKDEFFAHLPTVAITDAIGSSETGSNGMVLLDKDHTAMKSGPTVRAIGETVVLDENLDLVKPGSGVTGKIARTGDIPLGYYNDPVKTAEVFITVGGTRYVMPGDFATVEADGTDHAVGTGLGEHQLRWREDLPRGGRVGRPLPPRGVRRHRGRGARRPVGSAGGGDHPAPGRPPSDPRGHPAALPECHRRLQGASPATRRRDHRALPSGKPDYRWAADIVAEAPQESDSGGARTAAEAG